MLPSANRMRRASDFSSVVRGGVRARTGHLVVHHLVAHSGPTDEPAASPLVGFVVSKAVGNSVERHRVTRRLRAQFASRLPHLPASSRTVVRALPAAAAATSTVLGRDLDRALDRLAGHR